MKRAVNFWPVALLALFLSACGENPLNNPYPDAEGDKSVLYTSFEERPKHLDPAISYSADEYAHIAQIYEPPLQYHYLKRPYALVPLTAESLPKVIYRDSEGNALPDDAPTQAIAYSDYVIAIRPGILYQPHPAFAQDAGNEFLYHRLTEDQLEDIQTLADFEETGSRELTAEDYVYQIKRLVHPQVHSPIAGLMEQHIVGLKEFGHKMDALFRAGPGRGFFDVRAHSIAGVEVLDRYHYKIRIHGKYPQFRYWLAMPFFAPMPWEADVFYNQPGLIAKNITLDWYPIGTGPYMMAENNPNRQIVLARNPNFHDEFYPQTGEPEDKTKGLLQDAGKKLPFIDKRVSVLERESIPYWNKFLQGYYDASGIASDSFDQAIQFTGEGEVDLTPAMKAKRIHLQTAVTTSIFYTGFNMLDPIIGGYGERARKLRQALSIAVDFEEYISIFLNGRGVAAQGLVPPGIFGHLEGKAGVNPYVYDWANGESRRKSLAQAQRLMAEAGYPQGRDGKTGKSLTLYLDTVASGPDDKARLNWYRKQFAKLGIQLVVRTTDYNRFQQKMREGNAQIFMWGWNADYPDPENFFFLLYGPHSKAKAGGENAANYENPQFDRLFERMRNMENSPQRLALIQQMQAIVRRDAPWLFGFYPKSFLLHHDWYKNLKPNLMANNTLKYQKIDVQARERLRKGWNEPVYWPLFLLLALSVSLILPAWFSYRKRKQATAL